MQIVWFALKRIAWGLVVLVALSLLIFVIVRVVPGDPVRAALGARAPQSTVVEMRAQMGLDQPLYVQYARWLQGLPQGRLGQSLTTRRDVAADIVQFFPATLELALFAGVLMLGGGVLLGVLSARSENGWVDNAVRIFSYMGVVTPAFVWAILLELIFAYWLQWLPVSGQLSMGVQQPPLITGMTVLDALLSARWQTAWDGFTHLVLPAVSLAMAGLSQEARITRATMSDNIKKDYVLAQRAYGVPDRRILFRYLLKPSLIPTISIFGLDFASLFANAFLVELVFNWPGLSRYGTNAILAKDVNAVSGVVIVLGVTFVVVNILVDVVIGLLDPRARLGRESA